MIAGTSTAGIPWASWVADTLNLPMVYVRSSAKDHGRENLVEGKIKAGAQVVVIEDLISTGGSSFKVVEALQKEKMQVLGLLAIFSYEFRRANQLFESANLSVHTLTSFENLLKTAQRLHYLDQNDTNKVEKWREQFL
jgi:orotate phosphoribosyltransferase